MLYPGRCLASQAAAANPLGATLYTPVPLLGFIHLGIADRLWQCGKVGAAASAATSVDCGRVAVAAATAASASTPPFQLLVLRRRRRRRRHPRRRPMGGAGHLQPRRWPPPLGRREQTSHTLKKGGAD